MSDNKLARVVNTMSSTAKKLRKIAKELENEVTDIQMSSLFTDEELSKATKPTKKASSPYFAAIKDSFLEFFKWNKKVDYEFKGKDGAAIKRIERKLIKIAETKEVTMDKVYISNLMTQILMWIKDNRTNNKGRWLWENLSLAILDMKLPNILGLIFEECNTKDYIDELKNMK